MFLSSVFGSSFSVRVPASPRILGESAGATLQVINIMSPPEIRSFGENAAPKLLDERDLSESILW